MWLPFIRLSSYTVLCICLVLPPLLTLRPFHLFPSFVSFHSSFLFYSPVYLPCSSTTIFFLAFISNDASKCLQRPSGISHPALAFSSSVCLFLLGFRSSRVWQLYPSRLLLLPGLSPLFDTFSSSSFSHLMNFASVAIKSWRPFPPLPLFLLRWLSPRLFDTFQTLAVKSPPVAST